MKRIFPLFIVLVTLLSCSPGSDMLETGDPQLDPSDVPNMAIPTLDYEFKGVWTVDGLMGDTTVVRVRTSPERCLVSTGYDFPYKTIFAKVYPYVKVNRINDFRLLATNLITATKDEIEAISQLVNYCGWENVIDDAYRCIGISDKCIYMELKPSPQNNALFLPFVVTTDDGSLMPVLLTIAPTESTAVLDRNGTSFSCVFTIAFVRLFMEGATWNTVKQLKFTSIERVK